MKKKFKTPLGDVRIDIVVTINNKELFIEPYYTNPITEEKRNKLVLIDTPSFSINLMPFIHRFEYSYRIQDLKYFLIAPSCKNWEFNRKKIIERHIKSYLEYVKEEIEKNRKDFNSYLLKEKKLSDLNHKINELQKKISPIEREIYKLMDEKKELQDELNITDIYDI